MTRVWISFKLNDRKLKEKTDTWEVWSLDEASHIGSVRWYSPWRTYCFFPSSETVKQRKGKRAFSQEPACG